MLPRHHPHSSYGRQQAWLLGCGLLLYLHVFTYCIAHHLLAAGTVSAQLLYRNLSASKACIAK